MASLTRYGDDRTFTCWTDTVEHAMTVADANPNSGLGELMQAMDWWRNSPPDMQKHIEDALAIADRTDFSKPSRFQMKGVVPWQLYPFFKHFHPNFINDEFFLDEFFTRYPRFANPRWKPKPESEKVQRGISSYAKHVWRVIDECGKEKITPLLADLPQHAIVGGGDR